MSYCRWSSDDFKCDLYCYDDVTGGWTTHVAGFKHLGDCPSMPDLTRDNVEQYAEALNAQTAFMRDAKLVPLGLPHDGETFRDPTLEAFQARLLDLRAAGYRFPDEVLERVREEIMMDKVAAD